MLPFLLVCHHVARYILLFLLASQVGRAQQLPEPPRRSWALHGAPLSLLDPVRPTLQIGGEYFFLPYASLSAAAGTRAALVRSYRRPDAHLQHQTYRLEARYYFPAVAWSHGQAFVAGEFFYVPSRYTSYHGVLLRDEQYYTYDEARVRHRTWGSALKYGWRLAYGGHEQFWFETAVGLGLRRKPARYSGIRNEQPIDAEAAQRQFYPEWGLAVPPADGGHADRLHLALTVRVGYQFYR